MKNILIMMLAMSGLAVSAQQGPPRGNPYLDSLRNEKNQVAMLQLEKKYLNGSEQEMRAVYEYYSSINKKKSDSLRNIIGRRYPTGNTAFFLLRDRLYLENDLQAKERMLAQAKKDFTGWDFDEVTGYVVIAFAENRNVAKTKEYLAQIKSSSALGSRTLAAAEIIMKYDLQQAKTMVKQQIDQIDKAATTHLPYFTLYGLILTKEGKYDEALKYTQEAYDKVARKTVPLKVNYAFLLNKTGQHDKALPILDELITSGDATSDIRGAFQESYNKLNLGKDASAYLAELDNKRDAGIREKMIKNMLSSPAPNFSVKDVNGETVSLADFKGKTIVLDFWATWCGPCKKAFPAMQLALNRYKSDPNVKFLFIHTSEQVPDALTDAKNYLSNNNYNFDLYMDLRDPITKRCPAALAFGVSAIPAKFVIDGKGIIRFKATGFSGSDDAAAAEVVAMVELAKTAS